MTFDQVEARKDRGVEGLRRMGADDAADRLEDESVEDFAERKKITIVNPHPRRHRARHAAVFTRKGKVHRAGAEARRKKGSHRPRMLRVIGRSGKNPRRRRNSTVAEASQMFEKFHGRKPTMIQDIDTKMSDRRNLTGLGRLMYLQTADEIPMKFSERDKVTVACDPAGNQIYFVGGNQDITQILEQARIDMAKDLIVVGECQYIIYTTDKDFDNFEEKDYQHEFGEETGDLPVLVFDKLNRQLYLTGGAYEVKREGIVN